MYALLYFIGGVLVLAIFGFVILSPFILIVKLLEHNNDVKSRRKQKRISSSEISKKTNFHNGYAKAVTKNNALVTINSQYETIETKENYSVLSHMYGYYIMKSCDKNTYLFNEKLEKINLRYSNYEFLNNGYIRVKRDGKDGVINTNFKTIVPTECDFCIYLGNGTFELNVQNVWSIWKFDRNDRKEKEIILPGFISEVSTYNNRKYYKICRNERFGYCDDNFNVIIKPEYNTLSTINNRGYIYYEKNGESGTLEV